MNLPLFMESVKVVPFLASTACNASGASDRVSLENYERCAILLVQIQAAADAGTVTFDAHTAASGGSESSGITINEWWYLTDVTVGTTEDTWTKGTAAATFATSATDSGQSYYLFDIAAEDLNISGTSYPFVMMNTGSGSASNTFHAVAFLYQPSYSQASLVSAQS